MTVTGSVLRKPESRMIAWNTSRKEFQVLGSLLKHAIFYVTLADPRLESAFVIANPVL